MLIKPCPICRKPVSWETTTTRPFCSERCKLMDLGAWSAEDYRVALGSEDTEERPSLDEESELP